MIQFIHEGNAIDYTPPAEIPAGTAVVVGGLVGIARLRIPWNTRGALSLTGVYDIAKEPGVAIGTGVKVYLEEMAQLASPDDNGGARPYLGTTVADAAADDATTRFRLNH